MNWYKKSDYIKMPESYLRLFPDHLIQHLSTSNTLATQAILYRTVFSNRKKYKLSNNFNSATSEYMCWCLKIVFMWYLINCLDLVIVNLSIGEWQRMKVAGVSHFQFGFDCYSSYLRIKKLNFISVYLLYIMKLIILKIIELTFLW